MGLVVGFKKFNDAMMDGYPALGRPWVTYFANAMGLVNAMSLIFVHDPLGKMIFGLLFLNVVGICAIADHYHGIVKLMGLHHGIFSVTMVILTLLRLHTTHVAESSPGTLMCWWAHLALIINCLSTIFDVCDTVEWFSKPKRRYVIVGRDTMKELGVERYCNSTGIMLSDWLVLVKEHSRKQK